MYIDVHLLLLCSLRSWINRMAIEVLQWIRESMVGSNENVTSLVEAPVDTDKS